MSEHQAKRSHNCKPEKPSESKSSRVSSITRERLPFGLSKMPNCMLEAEIQKWEAREERIVEQLAPVKEDLHVTKVEHREDHVTQHGVYSSAGDVVREKWGLKVFCGSRTGQPCPSTTLVSGCHH